MVANITQTTAPLVLGIRVAIQQTLKIAQIGNLKLSAPKMGPERILLGAPNFRRLIWAIFKVY